MRRRSHVRKRRAAGTARGQHCGFGETRSMSTTQLPRSFRALAAANLGAGRCALRLAPQAAAPCAADRRGLERLLVRAAGGLCSLRRALARPEHAGGGIHARLLRRGDGAGCAAGAAGRRRNGVRPRDPVRTRGVGAGRRRNGRTPALPSGVLAGIAFFLFGAGPIVWTITTTTLRQSITPGAMLGRGDRRAGGRPLGRARLPGARIRGLRPAGLRDPGLEHERAAASAAGGGGRPARPAAQVSRRRLRFSRPARTARPALPPTAPWCRARAGSPGPARP